MRMSEVTGSENQCPKVISNNIQFGETVWADDGKLGVRLAHTSYPCALLYKYQYVFLMKPRNNNNALQYFFGHQSTENVICQSSLMLFINMLLPPN